MSPPPPHTVLTGEGMEGAEAMVAAEAANPSNVDIDALPYVDQQMEQIDQMKWVAATATHASCALLLARCSLPLAPCHLLCPAACSACAAQPLAACRLPLAPCSAQPLAVSTVQTSPLVCFPRTAQTLALGFEGCVLAQPKPGTLLCFRNSRGRAREGGMVVAVVWGTLFRRCAVGVDLAGAEHLGVAGPMWTI